METDMIKITHLKKSFGDVKAVNDLSFQVKKGEFFAFLGVNGAGKSTTISIICGQLRKDSGTVQIQGTDLDKIGRKVGTMLGVVFQDSVLDKPLTVRENLDYRYRNVPPISPYIFQALLSKYHCNAPFLRHNFSFFSFSYYFYLKYKFLIYYTITIIFLQYISQIF